MASKKDKSKTSTPKKPKAAKPAATEQKTEQQASSAFEILDEANLPERRHASRSVASPYPFATMEVGKGFQVEAKKADRDLYVSDEEYNNAVVEELRTIANRLSGATRRFTKKNADKKFQVYTAEKSVVVKRIA